MKEKLPGAFFRRTAHRSSVFSLEGKLEGLPLRVSNEGILRPRVARAQKIIGSIPSSVPGSTGSTWVSFPSFSPCAFCEQEGRPGCCLSSPI
jgi:hypothetical protein